MTNLEKQKYSPLYTEINNLITNLDVNCHLSATDKIRMTSSLFKFNIESIIKFIEGQKKHGGNIINKNLEHEFRMEFIDMFWYREAETWKESSTNDKNIKETNKENEVNTSEVEQQSRSSRP